MRCPIQLLRDFTRRGLRTRQAVCVAVACLLLLLCFPFVRSACRRGSRRPATTVLIDSVHAHNFLDEGLEPGNRDYHSLFGLRDAFGHLEANGFGVREVASGPLEADALEGVDILFINLVSDNLPPFLVGEIRAVKEFVTGGGSLLVITDHSNCYHHVHKLMPLFAELGLQLHSESALEQAPRTLGPGPGWIVIDHFRNHPITRGLSAVSFHTGGTVDEKGAVATLSENGWGDRWETAPFGENSLRVGNRGNYGNFVMDDSERKGELAVIAARTLGAGRIVVVGDQNVFGNLWIRYADNARLFLNVVSWLSDRVDVGKPSDFARAGVPSLLLLEDYARAVFADYGDHGFYHVYGILSRHYPTFVHSRVNDDFGLVVVSGSDYLLPPEAAAKLVAHLKEGRDILVLGGDGAPSNVARNVESLTGGMGMTPRSQEGDRAVYVGDGTGSLVLLRTPERFDNSAISAPTASPGDEERDRSAELLALVRGLLPGALRE
ncbi:MAG: hypothetical protein HOJ57_28310 [Lentisphaerae bacterium]|nr:hypothetical protein [Lentisphaerota bacterium]